MWPRIKENHWKNQLKIKLIKLILPVNKNQTFINFIVRQPKNKKLKNNILLVKNKF